MRLFAHLQTAYKSSGRFFSLLLVCRTLSARGMCDGLSGGEQGLDWTPIRNRIVQLSYGGQMSKRSASLHTYL